MSSAESVNKRFEFRRNLRNKQIQELFRTNRQRFIHEGNDNIENRDEFNIFSKEMGRSSMISEEIAELLLCEANNNFNIGFLSNETILKVLKLALEFRDEPCINEEAMIILIQNAEEDFKMVIGSKEEENRELKKIKCQRVGQILWILSNECSRCTEISLDLNERLVRLCIGLIKFEYEAKGQKINVPDMREKSKNDLEGLDEYVMGLCIMLLGNICISEEHVSCILNEIKLSELLEILNGLIDENNYEDLSFTISNILYYYPDLSIELRNCENERLMEQESQEELGERLKQERLSERYDEYILQCNQEQLELSRVLESLYHRLSDDLLFYIYNMLCRADQCIRTPAKIEGENRKQRSKFKIEISSEAKNFSKNKSNYHILELSEIEIKKIKENLGESRYGNEIDHNSSENYSKDLMECIDKVKNLLNSAFEKENQIYHKRKEIDQGSGSLLRLNRESLKKATEEKMYLIKEVEADVITMVIKMLIFFGRDRQIGECVYGFGIYRNRVSNMVIFIRDIYRHFRHTDSHWKEYQDKSTIRKELFHLQYDLNKQTHEIILKKYGKEIFEFIHGTFCGYESHHGEEDDLEVKNSKENLPNQELELDINNGCWEIYEYFISYLNRKACWGSEDNQENKDLREGRLLERKIQIRDSSNESKQTNEFCEMLNSEIDWLEMTLMAQKSEKELGNSRSFTRLNISQECKVIDILSKYNPIITAINTYGGMRENNGYSDLRSFEYREGIGSVEILELNLFKIHDFLSTMDYKLLEHQNDHPSIFSIVQSIYNIVERVRDLYASEQHEKCKMIPIESLLGSRLFHILEKDLSEKYMYAEDGHGAQIYELINQILQKDTEEMEMEETER